MILSVFQGDFKCFFGKNTKTWETWKTDFKQNISERKSKRFVLRKKQQQQQHKQIRKKFIKLSQMLPVSHIDQLVVFTKYSVFLLCSPYSPL